MSPHNIPPELPPSQPLFFFCCFFPFFFREIPAAPPTTLLGAENLHPSRDTKLRAAHAATHGARPRAPLRPAHQHDPPLPGHHYGIFLAHTPAPSLRIMVALAHSTNPVLNPDRNPLLRLFLKKSFYAQFCAGENAPEVRHTIARLKDIGFTGVILGYAREVVLSKDEAKSLDAAQAVEETAQDIANEINPWAEGTLETVRLAEPGDFVALKFTGAGRLALHQLQHRHTPSPHLYKSIDSICQLAHQRGVRLLFDAEQDMLQDGIDDWTMQFARKYNTSPELATIYGTYQAYKKMTPTVLSKHLAEAQKEGFTLGVKLVRGAYLGSDPRECFHDTKEQTDGCYNSIAASVLTRQWTPTVKGEGAYPNAHIVLATHNAESVRRARAICDAGGAKSDIAFAQLQGMADEVSCELVEASQSAQMENSNAPALPVYKYLVWGTTGECMKYLLRRAQENKDAVQRTRNGRDAMWAELVRRCKNVVGLA
ncbi:putative proline oxidase-like protein [Cladobotryum mycophilum]|uniref:Proline dehydrogenase n=1 Tax=Cladobotryum mycophilum TaxID=491253 RepID=A0ABR0S5H7_9HYPO